MEFKISDKITIEAEYYETGYSWGHKAWLFINGREVAYKKATYYNRTWESYQYQSVCQSVVEKAHKEHYLTDEEAEACQKWLKDYTPNSSPLKSIAMVAMMGDILTDNREDANDWKERMLKAGLPEGAITMPEDWKELSEVEKQRRLDGAIKALS